MVWGVGDIDIYVEKSIEYMSDSYIVNFFGINKLIGIKNDTSRGY